MMGSINEGKSAGSRPRMAIYGLLAVAGIVCPWYYNILYIRGLDGPFNILRFFGEGFTNPAGSSLTIDHLIASVAALIWVLVEGRRLGMRSAWFFVLWSLLVAVASGLPLFLLARERVLSGTCRRLVIPSGGMPWDVDRGKSREHVEV